MNEENVETQILKPYKLSDGTEFFHFHATSENKGCFLLSAEDAKKFFGYEPDKTT